MAKLPRPPRVLSDPGAEYIFRPWRTLPDGRRIYARAYGLRAFKIYLRN